MESLLSQDVGVVSLLLAFIIGVLTKRFVPWWVHEEVVNKLKEYEDTAPELIDEMQRMMAILEDPRTIERLNIVAPKAKEVAIMTEELQKIRKEATTTTASRPRRSRPRTRRSE